MFQNSTRDPSTKTLATIGRSVSNGSSLTALSFDISPSSSHYFEVLYIGKVRLSKNKIPEGLIDTALKKFKLIESTKQNNKSENVTNVTYNRLRRPSQDTAIRLLDSEFNINKNALPLPLIMTGDSKDGLAKSTADTQRNGYRRTRSNSLASLNSTDMSGGDQNRTMVFQVGKTDLRLISPDRKQILLHKFLRDVVTCKQGRINSDHFSVICFDSDAYLGYVFKCQSDSIAAEIILAITQSQSNSDRNKTEKAISSCERCPMIWLHKLQTELEGTGLTDKKKQGIILKKIEELPMEEQESILAKLHSAERSGIEHNVNEQNLLLLSILKAHCEVRQGRHIHDTAENRHEFLNHYLGGSTIFMKAKRSLTNSFDQLLKRKPSRDDLLCKELSLPAKLMTNNKECGIRLEIPPSDVSSTNDKNDDENELNESTSSLDSPQRSISNAKTMMDIFLKVGNSPRSSTSCQSEDEWKENKAPNDTTGESGSWRQAIYNNVVTPNKHKPESVIPKSRDDLRALWKKAINQQILLIRMEKENASLRARQEEATVKRIKLEYEDIGPSALENTEVWEIILNKEKKKKYDDLMLRQAIRRGVPRAKRGEVWIFLGEQYCSRMPPPVDLSKFPNYNLPYEQLLKQLTSQQHAILIDLGRTFPNHTYFMSPLGPGQLALYNLLKAYSLLDPEVGYCQGLSFIAAILLLHMSEEHAFIMLRHLMIRRNFRLRYLPDMKALQIQLYQLSRLVRDYLPELYSHFDAYEVSPTLYAAPWLLTLFASQFTIGFVARVLDFILVDGNDVTFKVIISLLSYHKDKLLQCDGFEPIMDYLKTSITFVDNKILEFVIKEVCKTDISKDLLEYSVEYNVLQEELSTPRPEIKRLKQAEETIQNLHKQNDIIKEQWEVAMNNNRRLESSKSNYLSQINKLECELRSMEVTVATLGNFISSFAYNKNDDFEIPSDVLRILSQLNTIQQQRRKSTIKSPLTDSDSDITNHVNDSSEAHHIRSQSLNTKNSSSYFAKSFDQIRQQKLSSILSSSNDMEGFKKSYSDSRNIIKFDKIIEEGPCEKTQSLGNKPSDRDMENLKVFQQNYEKSSKKYPLKTSKSNLELISGHNDLMKQKGDDCNDCNGLPLYCGGINISCSEITKLPSIKPRLKSDGNLPNISIIDDTNNNSNNNNNNLNTSSLTDSTNKL